METLQTDVLVVGAGPTGLMAANQLHRFGINFIIIDKKSGPTLESRAIAVTARSLEIYQQMGLSDEVVENGQKIEVGNLFQRGKRRATVRIGELGKGQSDFSYMLAYEQSKNEEILSRNLISKGASIFWGHEFKSLMKYQGRIEVLAQHGEVELTIKAKYLIACDGASSPIRQLLNFSFRGGTYKHKFFVADAQLDWSLPYEQLIISPGNKSFSAFLPLQGNNTFRIIGTLPKSYFDVEKISFDDIKEVVISAAGVNISFEKVNWFSTYKLHHRGVEEFRQGNVFLAGDSAHIHSPAGGQGMNTGLQDAYNLSWKMAMVIKGEALPDLLDTYNEERLPFAKWLLRFTDRGFNMMTSSNIFIRLFRRLVVMNVAGFAARSSFLRPLFFKTISQIWYSYHNYSLALNASTQKLEFNSGDRFPYIKDESVYTKLINSCFHMVCLSESSLNDETREFLNQVIPFKIEIVEIPVSDAWRRLGVTKDLFILVRPDNYILLIADSLHSGIIQQHFRYFNL